MSPQDRETLIEEVTSAWRPTNVRSGGRKAHPAWHDLDAGGREAAHHATVELRALESAMDPDGLSTTAHAVLGRIRGAS